jgi:hypothetical protein
MTARSQAKRNRRKFFTILVAALSQERYNSLSMEDWEWLRWENQPLAARDEPLVSSPVRSSPRLARLPRLFQGRTSVPEPTCTLGANRVVLLAFFWGTMGFTVLSRAYFS